MSEKKDAQGHQVEASVGRSAAANEIEWQWIPKRADEALLRPFYNCPPDELPMAWQAMLRVAEVKLNHFLAKETARVIGGADNPDGLIAALRASDSVPPLATGSTE